MLNQLNIQQETYFQQNPNFRHDSLQNYLINPSEPHGPIESGNYRATYDNNTGFLSFDRNGYQAEPGNDRGWKLHVSTQNISDCWNTILPILDRYGVSSFKIANPNIDFNGTMQGKEITIYMFPEKDRALMNDQDGKQSWNGLINEISQALHDRGHEPSQLGDPGFVRRREYLQSKGLSDSVGLGTKEHKIKGTPYVSYRNDEGNIHNPNYNPPDGPCQLRVDPPIVDKFRPGTNNNEDVSEINDNKGRAKRGNVKGENPYLKIKKEKEETQNITNNQHDNKNTGKLTSEESNQTWKKIKHKEDETNQTVFQIGTKTKGNEQQSFKSFDKMKKHLKDTDKETLLGERKQKNIKIGKFKINNNNVDNEEQTLPSDIVIDPPNNYISSTAKIKMLGVNFSSESISKGPEHDEHDNKPTQNNPPPENNTQLNNENQNPNPNQNPNQTLEDTNHNQQTIRIGLSRNKD